MQIGGKRWTVEDLKEFLKWARENGIEYVAFGNNSFSFNSQSTGDSNKPSVATTNKENTVQSEEVAVTESKPKIGGVYDDADLYNSI